MAELGIGHSSPYVGGPALITPLPAYRNPALYGVQEFRAYLSEAASLFYAPHFVCFVLSSVGCQPPRLRSRRRRLHLGADSASAARR